MRTKKYLIALLTLALVMSQISLFPCSAVRAQESAGTENEESALLQDEETGDNPEEDPEPLHVTHTWSEWKITKKATAFTKGKRIRHCTYEGCDAVQSEVTPKLKVKKTWVRYKNHKYYFNSEGKKSTGWHKIRKNNKKTSEIRWCYFNKKGRFIKSVKATIKNKQVKLDGKRFYFNKKSRPIRIKNDLQYYACVYGTYVLVDISSQKLYFYRNGKRLRVCRVVTGTVGARHTPLGTFHVTGKARNVTFKLGGHSDYWIAFIGHSHGLHDAQWRPDSDFNSNKTYLTNGSHGCVNMRLGDVAYIYERINVGNVVIVRQ